MQFLKYQTVMLALAGAIGLAGCSARGADNKVGYRLIIFLDQTASIDAAQRTAWTGEASGLARQLAGGSSITIYPIHDRTMDAAPLFQADIPVVSDNATSDIALAGHKALLRARNGSLAAIEKGLDTGPAIRTDIFSSIDRIRPDPLHRRTMIVYFSDMLNSTPDLNMETPGTIKRPSIGAQIEALARRHYWQTGQLAGDDVYCVLNSIESGHRGPAVDRLTQKAFYDALFQALGARLVSYETHLTGSVFGAAAPGGPYVASR